jgi:hypothetical protein
MVKTWLFRKLHFQPPFRKFSWIPQGPLSVPDSIIIGEKEAEKSPL